MAYYEFAGFAFRPRASDGQPMVSASGLLSSERHVPYSNFTVLDLGGRTPRRFATSIRLDPDQVIAFEGLIGTTGPLTVAGIEWSSATLLAMDNHTMTPGGEYHFYDASWILGS